MLNYKTIPSISEPPVVGSLLSALTGSTKFRNEMRREHPRWGPLRLVDELAKAGVRPVPSRMSAYRALVRHGLVEPGTRRRRKDTYRRWEREAAMALWQIDIMGGAFMADGTEAKIVTGVDDHSRYCVICQVVVRATGRAVCLAFAAALREFGVPGEVLTDIQDG